jgi:hypothetical protein
MTERPKRPAPPTREEIAQRELGTTTIDRGTIALLFCAFLATIVFVPILQVGVELARGQRPGFLAVFDRAPTERALSEFEQALDDESIVGQAVLPRVQDLLVRVGAGNEQAYIGDDGWLFHRPGFDYVTGRGFLDPDVLRARALGGKSWDPRPVPDPTPAIVDFRDQLAARGIALVVMPTPLKPQFDPTGRVAERQGPLQNPSYRAWRASMADAGVDVFDPAALLDEIGATDAYLKTDTHWRPAAMERVARALAERLGPALPDVAPAGYTRERREVTNLGDIAVMLRLPESQMHFPRETVSVEAVRDAAGRPWQSEESADVLVLGDSFTNIYSVDSMNWGTSAGFVETLSFVLQRPVDRLAVNGGGAVTTRRALRDELARGRDRLLGKRVVVWQFAVRELAVGDWQIVPLPEVTAENTAPERARATVRARIVQRATPPAPGSVPYDDCLIGVEVEIVEVVSGAAERGQALIYVEGMRDNVWTRSARWAEGAVVELELVPWRDAGDDVRSINRRELEDDDLMLLDPWWAVAR